MTIDWSAPENTKEAVVREAVPGARCFGEVFDGDPTDPSKPGTLLGNDWDEAYEHPLVQEYVAAHRTQEALDGTPCNRDIQDGDGNDEEGRAIPGKNSEICWACSGYGGRFGTCVTCHGPGLLPAGTRNAAVKAREAQEAPAEAQEQHACDCWIRERQVCDICQGVSPGPTQPTHSAAERERAAEQLARFSPIGPQEFLRQATEGSWMSLLLDKQMALNAANAQIAELESK